MTGGVSDVVGASAVVDVVVEVSTEPRRRRTVLSVTIEGREGEQDNFFQCVGEKVAATRVGVAGKSGDTEKSDALTYKVIARLPSEGRKSFRHRSSDRK